MIVRKQISLIIGLCMLTSACTDEESSRTAISDRTYSVDELLADEPLLSDFLSACKNNPGELGAKPNCVNAFTADHRLSIRKERDKLKK